jgi:hypothetical protein
MCPVKWQRHYNLMNNFTPVSTRALFMVLENIESNVVLNEKPPSKDKAKGAGNNTATESIAAVIVRNEANYRSSYVGHRYTYSLTYS